MKQTITQPSFLYYNDLPFKVRYTKPKEYSLTQKIALWIIKNYRKEFLIAFIISIGLIPQPRVKAMPIQPISIPELSDPMVTVSSIPAVSGVVEQSFSVPSELSQVPVPVVQPVSASVTPSASTGCVTGVTVGDYYTNLVMQRESGGNSCATNPSGACGLFQALPCSKMGCSLADVACQEAWGESYIQSTYGSSATAWNSEVTRGWY